MTAEKPMQQKNPNGPPSKTLLTRQKVYKSLGAVVCDLAGLFKPPERLKVSESASRYVHLNTPGAYVGPYLNSMAHYMVEPMDVSISRDYTGEIFVGPAQAGKTQSLLLNKVAHHVKVDPMDILLFCPTQSAARDFSMRRVDRMHRHSPEIGMMLGAASDADNKFDKQYTNGMMLTLSWPSVTEFAGRPVGIQLLTDYDRMDDDIGGDGNAYDLASKRGTTFGSFAMCLAESTPSREVKNPKWIRKTRHEAPPCDGILGLYNRGDRRRRYWPCPDCGSYFEANFSMLVYERRGTNLESGETVRLQCPHCEAKVHPDQRSEMDMWGIWLKDGQWIDEYGIVRGETPRTSIASFWLNGVAASFVTWKKLVELYLNALDSFERTGSQEELKKFYNNDLGEPFLPRGSENERLPEVLKSRAEKLPQRKVPANTRILFGTVDVQKNRFIAQVFGVQPGTPFDLVLIDRFDIAKSKRLDADGDPYMVRPHTFLEDWNQITEQLISKTYELDDDSGRHMSLRMTVGDSGGREGVTTNAYNYWRSFSTDEANMPYAGRFHLVKGDHTRGIPRARITYPDSNRRDKFSVARGDVPVLMFNSNELKDVLSNRLMCTVPGKGVILFPDWLEDWFWAELCEEVRDDKGWHNPNNHRNEAWDLGYYALGLCVSPLLPVEKIDWERPPLWAEVWDKNPLVFSPDKAKPFERPTEEAYDFAQLGKALG
jgi:phage terminase large subunit GpA-like protein